jgi:Spy/CpxP family protein refolding chaperone
LGEEVMPMLIRSGVLLSLALVVAAPAFGCGGSVAAAPVVVPGGTRAPVAQSAHGPIKFLGAALGDVPLTAAQRGQIEKLASDADARHEGERTARRDLLLLLATQVEAGAIDRTALQPRIDAIAGVVRAAQPLDRAAFEQLHAILGPDQRVALADAVEARGSRALGQFAEHGGMREWADALKLTDAQRDQIKSILKQSAEAGKGRGGHDHGWDGGHRGAKILEAFKQDRFVFDEVAPPRDAGQQTETMADRFLTVAVQVLPVLTPEQRTAAATRLRERSNAADSEPMP